MFSRVRWLLLVLASITAQVYGIGPAGSPEADWRVPGDLNEDHCIDLMDLMVLVNKWLDPNCGDGCQADLSGNGGVNAADFAVLANNWGVRGTTLVISEFMASNGAAEPLRTGDLLDENKEPSDWIEIHNPTARAINLDGWSLVCGSDRWRFPNGLIVWPAQYLIVFASAKNRAVAGKELHTNFELDVEGEYLALVMPDGGLAHQYAPEYPKQQTDISYGLVQQATLAAAGQAVSYHVPAPNDSGSDWTATAFEDAGWPSGPAPLCFSNASAGFEVKFYKATVSVTDLSIAESVAGNSSVQSFVAGEYPPVINYVNTGLAGNFADDNAFPGTTKDQNVDHFVVVVTGVIYVPQAGQWTFAVNCDEGFSLALTKGLQVFGMSYPGPAPRGAKDTLSCFYFSESGFYNLRLIMYECTGDSALELSAARGSSSSFNLVQFRLIGDVANGGLAAGREPSTDVERLMRNANASLWTRVEFDSEKSAPFDSLLLRMRYDDGFIAYLNGVEVARDNFSGPPAWNSAAGVNRADALSQQFAEFDISDRIDLLEAGKNVLAIHALNDSASDGQFIVMPELAVTSKRLNHQYFAAATPGAQNHSAFYGVVAEPQFSHDRGFFQNSFLLTIATNTEGAAIYYTLNGSDPYDTTTHFAAGNLYTQPIPITKTTCIRAKAVKQGWKPSSVVTHTYLINESAAVKSLPVVSLVGDHGETFYEPHGVMAIMGGTYQGGVWTSSGPGSYNNPMQRGEDYERPVSFEWVKSADNSGFQIDCGVRVHGSDWQRPRYTRSDGYWTGNSKFSFRLYFRGRYGQDWLEYPLFPFEVERFGAIVLRAGHNDQVNPFIKDELIRRLHKDMGHVDSGGTMANLFVNGLYKGYYNPCEHIKDSFCQQWYNSDLPWDVMTMSGIRDGTTANWNAMISYAQSHSMSNSAYYQEFGKKLDIPGFADYLILQLWNGNWDWPQNNWSAAAEQSPQAIWRFFIWDAEGAMFSNRLTTVFFSSLNSQGNANGILYRALKASPEFKRTFGDRIYKHFYNGGALTEPNIRKRFLALRDQMLGVIPNMDMYALNTWVPQRLDIFLNACRQDGMFSFIGPTLNVNGKYQHGGYASVGSAITMTNPYGTGAIYYTLDGSEPAFQPQVPVNTPVTLVTAGAPKRVLIPTESISDEWKGGGAYSDSRWLYTAGEPGGIGYERVSGYAELISLDVGSQMYGINGSCYVRIPFTCNDDPVSFDSLTLKVRYDDGFIAYLNGQPIQSINPPNSPAWNSITTGGHEDAGPESFDVTALIPHLRKGANILAIHAVNAGSASSDFLVLAELVANRKGSSGGTTPAVQYTGPIALKKTVQVKSRVFRDDVWSAMCEAVFAVGPVKENLRITEIMYHPCDANNPTDPNDPNEEFIELKNIGAQTINLNLAKFANGIDFVFSDVNLAPGAYTIIVENKTAFQNRYGTTIPIAGQYIGKLDNAGERIQLVDAVGTTILDFEYKDGWHDVTDGQGYSLTIINPANPDANSWDMKDCWRASVYAGGSPGSDDSGLMPNPGDVVINEVLAHAHAEASDWIELCNTTGKEIDIGGWFLSDANDDLFKYEIAAGTKIPVYGYKVFYEGVNFGNSSFDPGKHVGFALSENGEKLYLTGALDGFVTGYRDVEEFGASLRDISFGRYFKKSTGTSNFVALSYNTPWLGNSYPKVGPIVISEIMYNPDWPAVGAYTNDSYEYVELRNITDAAVTLYQYDRQEGWRFTEGIEYQFAGAPNEVTIPADGYIVVVRNVGAFRWRYPEVAADKIYGPYTGVLDNAGEKLELSMPGDVDRFGVRQWIRIDRVVYSDGSHADGESAVDLWPTAADGLGSSLQRLSMTAYGNDPNNWTAATPTPGK